MNKKIVSTYDREMQNPKFRKVFKKEYKKLLLSELVHAIMQEEDKSVRQLAQEIGLSPTVVQKIRSGKQEDMKVKNFFRMLKACGYVVFAEKNKHKIPLSI